KQCKKGLIIQDFLCKVSILYIQTTKLSTIGHFITNFFYHTENLSPGIKKIKIFYKKNTCVLFKKKLFFQIPKQPFCPLDLTKKGNCANNSKRY
ncbi:MAG: hypothetical protein K2I05_01855, partial [Mailhella sp.]|nr:hypothetical protein [Mailhella sp.]